jgi:hypothetical protein
MQTVTYETPIISQNLVINSLFKNSDFIIQSGSQIVIIINNGVQNPTSITQSSSFKISTTTSDNSLIDIVSSGIYAVSSQPGSIFNV